MSNAARKNIDDLRELHSQSRQHTAKVAARLPILIQKLIDFAEFQQEQINALHAESEGLKKDIADLRKWQRKDEDADLDLGDWPAIAFHMSGVDKAENVA